jgi:erythromycin esterase-like protein
MMRISFFTATFIWIVVICLLLPLCCEGKGLHGSDFNWDVRMQLCNLQRDSTLLVDGEYPFKLSQQDVGTFSIKGALQFLASRFIHLDKDYHQVAVSLNSRSENLDSFWLIGAAIDERDNIISKDSVDLFHEYWTTDTLKLSCKNAKYISLQLRASGSALVSDRPQSVWLNKIKVSANEPYDQIPSGKIPRNVVALLKDPISEVPIPLDKKIVAFGETIHGCPIITETQIELIKHMVEKGRCRLIVWEYWMPDALYWNLYIHGDVPKENLKAVFGFAPESYAGIFPDFLDWLRAYNLSHDRKVKIVGNLNYYNVLYGAFFYYLDAFYNENSSEVLLPLMEMVAKGVNAKNYIAENEPLLCKIMGTDNYRDFSFSYSLCNRMPEAEIDWMHNRDYHMARISEHYIDSNLADYESAVMVAHASHVSKKYSQTLWRWHSMGQRLNKQYGDDYYSVAMTVGRGEFLNVRMRSEESYTRKYPLGEPIASTLEDICLTQFDEDLWIDTSLLPDPVFAYRHVGRAFISSNETKTGNIKERFNGVLFIKDSHVSGDYERVDSIRTDLGLEKFIKLFRYQKEMDSNANADF